jgi:lipooligosaccharide transport system permease protein
MNSVYFPRWRSAFQIWRRNSLVWRRLIVSSLVINFGEPFVYLLGFGYGIGMFIGEMGNMPYLTFVTAGILASSAMNVASFEAMFSVYTRMVPQRTYDAILATPVDVQDVLAGEMTWCATKALINAGGILIVATLLGAIKSWTAMLTIPVIFLTGLCFAGLGLIMTALAKGYDFFNYYVTLLLTPMFILSGVFYPVNSLPPLLQTVVQFLPLTHAVDLIRPLVAGQAITDVPLHLGVLAVYAVVGYFISVHLIRKRLLT